MPSASEPIQIEHEETGNKRVVPRGQLRALGKHGWREVTEPDPGAVDGTTEVTGLDAAPDGDVVTEPDQPWLTTPSEED